MDCLSRCRCLFILHRIMRSSWRFVVYPSHPRSFLQMEVHEAYTYTYNLFISNTPLQVVIL